jgi:hypothetical protein
VERRSWPRSPSGESGIATRAEVTASDEDLCLRTCPPRTLHGLRSPAQQVLRLEVCLFRARQERHPVRCSAARGRHWEIIWPPTLLRRENAAQRGRCLAPRRDQFVLQRPQDVLVRREERLVDLENLQLQPAVKLDGLVHATRTGLSQQPLPDGVVEHGLMQLLRPVRDNGRPIGII